MLHSLSIGPLGLAIDYVMMWGALLLALVLLRLLVTPKALRDATENTLFAMFVAALLGARISFVWRMWDQYQADVWTVLDIRDGGFLPEGGLVAAVLVLLYRIQQNPDVRRPALKVLSITAACVLPIYLGINLYNRDERMPVPALFDLAHHPVNLSDYSDKPIVINFWATWCPPCRREMPVLQDAQQAFQHIHFIFVNQGEAPEPVRQFLAEQELTLSNVFLDTSTLASEAFGVAVLPTTLFYSPDGKLLYRHVGGVSAASLEYALERVSERLE